MKSILNVFRFSRKRRICYFSQFVLVVLSAILVVLAPVRAFAYTNLYDPSEALRFLPPLESDSTDGDIDPSLTDFLKVTVYQKTDTGWDLVDEFTSQGNGSERLRLEGNHYHVNWHTSVPSTGGEFRIEIAVASLEIDFLDVTLEKGSKKEKDIPADGGVILPARGGVPIKFIVTSHPMIRARVLTEQGNSAYDIAQVLLSEFGLSAIECAQILYNENHDAPSVGIALNLLYGLGSEDLAALFKAIGFTAEEVASALQAVYGLDGQAAAVILKAISFGAEEVASALQAVYGLGDQAAAAILKAIGFGAEEIAGALQVVYGLGAQDCADILKAVGFGVEEVATALQQVYGVDAEAGAQLLWNAGYDTMAVVSALQDVYGKGPQESANIMTDLDAAFEDIADALKEVWDWLMDVDIVGILKAAGWPAEYAGQWLIDLYGDAWDTMVYLLHDGGFTFWDVAYVTIIVLGAPIWVIGEALYWAGIGWVELVGIFVSLGESLVDIILNLGGLFGL